MKKYVLFTLIAFGISALCFFTTAVLNGKDHVYAQEYLPVISEAVKNTDKKYEIYGGMMENLAKKYPDICGWVNVEDTKISYPLLLTTDNEYYVRKAYDGSYDKNGSITVDYRLKASLTENRNIILYGHNMASGNMFAYLKNPEKFINADVEIYSNGKLAIYKPYAAYIESGSGYIKTAFESQEELKNYVKTGKDKSIIDFGITSGEDPYLLTLVTCESSFGLGEKRIIVHAVLTEVYED